VKEGRCKHFNGLIHDTCAAGLAYHTVRDATARPFLYPCYEVPEGMDQPDCAARDLPTAEELVAERARVAALVEAHCKALAEGKCPTCGAAMEQRQVGRCVYAWPCGHRLYQGQAKVGG